MKDRRVIRANERYRSISRTLLQLGSALFAASIVKLHTESWSLEFTLWLLSSFVTMFAGLKIIDLLDSEDE